MLKPLDIDKLIDAVDYVHEIKTKENSLQNTVLKPRLSQVTGKITIPVQQGFEVVLCGSPSPREIKLGEDILQKMKNKAVNLIGKTSLKQLCALLKEAKLVLAPDSGPAHIATTQNTPVIGLYGHSNPLRTGPYLSLDNVVSVYEKHVQIQHHKPASELPWSTRAKGGHIMHDINTNDVIAVFDRLTK